MVKRNTEFFSVTIKAWAEPSLDNYWALRIKQNQNEGPHSGVKMAAALSCTLLNALFSNFTPLWASNKDFYSV